MVRFGYFLLFLLFVTLASSPVRADRFSPCMPSSPSVEARFLFFGDDLTLHIEGNRNVILADISVPSAAQSGFADVKDLVSRELKPGDILSLFQFDDPVDRYGRLRAHVMYEFRGAALWLQKELITQGLARVSAITGRSSCLVALLAAEERARSAGRHFWGQAIFKVYPADPPVLLIPFVDSFQIIEGRVRSVKRGRKVIFLDFGPDWKADSTLMIPLSQEDNLAARGVSTENLVGRRVRFRGWIKEVNGPAVTLSNPDFLEILE
ncbi:MAG: thermonuclease family protein [Alphaproteobacteria bacterium]|nr:thermonuclease family protein [Alphaproteobacteria bacterium]